MLLHGAAVAALTPGGTTVTTLRFGGERSVRGLAQITVHHDERAVAPGSTYRVVCGQAPSVDRLSALMVRGVGLRRREGFGALHPLPRDWAAETGPITAWSKWDRAAPLVRDRATGLRRGAPDKRLDPAPIRRDPSDMPHLPGFTVAGSLRAHCESAGLSHLFGGAPDDQARTASAVQVLGTRLLAWQAPLVRTRTSIDRRRGSAAERTLHAVEQLPVGTKFDIMLRWDGASDADLAAFRRAVASWVPVLGRGSSLGAGRCAVTGFGERTFDLGSVDGLIDWLALSGPADYPQPAALHAGPSLVPVLRSVLFEIVDALHVGSGRIDRGDDGHHVSRVVRSDSGFVLPGSSIKGVLRARAEYICRVLGVPACAGSARPSCVESLPCRTCRLFGRGARAGGEGSRRSLVAIPDAVISGAEVECRRHVAIDRFTGGAREALLYTDEVLVRGRFRIVVEALDSGVDAADLALVDAVLTDLHDGLVGFGARTTAGYGTVCVVDPSWDPPELARLAELLREAA